MLRTHRTPSTATPRSQKRRRLLQLGTAHAVSSGLGTEKGEQRGARLTAASPWRRGRFPHGPGSLTRRPLEAGSASRAPTGTPGRPAQSPPGAERPLEAAPPRQSRPIAQTEPLRPEARTSQPRSETRHEPRTSPEFFSPLACSPCSVRAAPAASGLRAAPLRVSCRRRRRRRRALFSYLPEERGEAGGLADGLQPTMRRCGGAGASGRWPLRRDHIGGRALSCEP